MKSGILLIRKKVGMTSYDVIRELKKKFHTSNIGHAGTLDPFASGLLIIGINEGTKLLPFLEIENKEYIARLEFGKATDTGDLTGKTIEEKNIIQKDKFEVLEILNSFLGEYTFTPPKYSAKKLDGKPLYEYARNNIDVKIKPETRYINKINLISLDEKSLIFYANVSKGTYIRTLGEDIAKKLDNIGYLTDLSRIAIGRFHIRQAQYLESVKEENIISLIDALPYKKIEIEDISKVKNGVDLKLDKIEDEFILITNKNKLISIYEYKKDLKIYHCKRGFNDEDILSK